MKLTPVQSLGDLSYAVYLWHWPIIALLPEALGRPLNGGARLAVLAAVVLAAYLTKILVEDPVRYGRLRAAGPRRTFALALAGMAAVAVPAAVCSKRLRAEVARDAAAAASLRSSDPRCYGAAARNPEGPPCRNPELDGVVVPSALLNSWSPDPAPEEAPTAGQDDFEARGFGAPPSEARKTFVLVGDSHAIQMLPAFRRLADAMHWRGYGAVRCPAVMGLAECASWNRDLFRWLKAHPEADTLFTTSASPSMRGRVDGFVREWKALPPSIKRIVVIRDNPHIRRPDCLERAARDGEDPARVCFDARASALLPDTEVLAALRVGSPRVRVIDLTDLYCDAERCPHLIGGVRVYADRGHLTQEYAATLFPYILRRLLAGGAGICYKSFSTDR